MSTRTIFVTGGAGFIGSALVRSLVNDTNIHVVNIDKLTYSGCLENLTSVVNNPNYTFEQGDICEAKNLSHLFRTYQPTAVMHLAAESHVDRSVGGPRVFLETNVVGTFTLLEQALEYWNQLSTERREKFRFLHVSTDEVFGTLGDTGLFNESAAYAPNSPYSATKAASDHLVRAWQHTYNFPTLMTNCSNNYGPFQFPEKLIPVVISSCLNDKPIPVYGNGKNVRDWLFVDDHVAALKRVLEAGRVGDHYNIGGRSERTNLQVVEKICATLNKIHPRKSGKYEDLISFVKDRPGHDWRYAVDSSKLENELGWRQTEDFSSGMEKTVKWYLENTEWCKTVAAKNKGAKTW